jgi:hypothetical protein
MKGEWAMKTSAPLRWPIVLAGCVLAILSGCGAEGEGSIHIGRTPTSKVMVLPDRKPPAPSQTRAPIAPRTPKANPAKR